MLAYSLLLGARTVLGFRVFLQEEVLQNLKYYFPLANEISRVESLCSHTTAFPWTTWSTAVDKLRSRVKGHVVQVHSGTRLLGNNINLRNRWNTLLEPVSDNVRKTFRFREFFTKHAEDRLRKIVSDYRVRVQVRSDKRKFKRKKTKKKDLGKIDIVFVGVHIRKTDADRFYVQKYNLPALEPSYYLQAMDFYRQKFKHSVFVVTGDDMDWVRSRLLPRVGSASVYPVGDGRFADRDAVGIDLATMSLCNHTILSHGTYSFWAGFFSGGLRIIPSMVFGMRGGKPSNPLDSKALGTFNFTDYGLVYASAAELEAMQSYNADNQQELWQRTANQFPNYF